MPTNDLLTKEKVTVTIQTLLLSIVPLLVRLECETNDAVVLKGEIVRGAEEGTEIRSSRHTTNVNSVLEAKRQRVRGEGRRRVRKMLREMI